MNVRHFVCNPFGENTYLAFDETREAVVIDPGFYDEREFLVFKSFLERERLSLKKVLNTHLHLDHCIGNGFVKREWNLDACAHEADLFLLQNAGSQARMFGLEISEELPTSIYPLQEGEALKVGNMDFEVLEVPGHSAGGLAFYEKKAGAIFAGDVLFRGSYGRYDLPGGDFTALKHSIVEKLFKLPENTVVFSGHGLSTTIGNEKIGNDILGF